MAKKIQQYYILKLKSGRLKKSRYNLSVTLGEARKNGEVVSIGDSQMLRSLRQIKGQNISTEDITALFQQRTRLKKKRASEANSIALVELETQIDNLLYVPEIIAIMVEDNRHYETINRDGLFINGLKYVRLLCSAGNARRNTAIFIQQAVEAPLKELLRNDIDKELSIIPAKYNAYFSLASSATLEVSTPYFAVVADCEIEREETVELVIEDETGDDNISVVRKLTPFNLWDGQGLISPKKAQEWASDLGLDYVPSAFIVRSNFIKGMVSVFDFHRFSDECGVHIIKDVWGHDYNIRDADLVITQSQFKTWNGWSSLEEYVHSCNKNNMGWGISRWTPKQEKSYCTMNYQFLQALELPEEKVASLCEKTVSYFDNIINNIWQYSLLYLLGEMLNKDYDHLLLDKVGDNVTKALLLNNWLINDPYVKTHIVHSINKKIKDSYIGNLYVDGFYTMMINDPYALCEHVFGLPVVGLLARDEHYNKYWKDKGRDRVAGMRAPLTWKSEVNILNLIDRPEVADWFRYLYNGVIYNVHGCDHMLHGGSDCDGDIVCITDQPDIVASATGGLPIDYATKKATKAKVVESELYVADMKGFNTKVGFLTNLSTTMYAMLPIFDPASQEYAMLINRLKQCRKEQGAIIDATKGLEIRPIPTSWTKYKKGDDFNNRILIDKRPYFMRYLYSGYAKKYKSYNNTYENYCITTFGKPLTEVLNNPETDKEQEVRSKYYRFSPLLDTKCVMNNISHYMESQVKEIRTKRDTFTDFSLLKSEHVALDKVKLKEMYLLYKKYKNEKRNFAGIVDSNGEEMFRTLEQYNKAILQEAYKISSNEQELANMAVVICYEIHPSDNKSFVWQVFGEGLLENIREHKQQHSFVPFLDEKGDIEYLGRKYSLKEIDLNIVEESLDEYYL